MQEDEIYRSTHRYTLLSGTHLFTFKCLWSETNILALLLQMLWWFPEAVEGRTMWTREPQRQKNAGLRLISPHNKLTYVFFNRSSGHHTNHCTFSCSCSPLPLFSPLILNGALAQAADLGSLRGRDKMRFALRLSCLSLQYKCTKLFLTQMPCAA